jgi:hypothetical protein
MRLLWFVLLAGCGTVKNASPDAPPGSDDAPIEPACGDGIRSPGEVCYKTPVTILATAAVYNAQLADMDSDGDLDVVFLLNNQIHTSINANGVFAATSIAGATAIGPHLLAADFDNDQKIDAATAGTSAAGGNAVGMFKGDGTAHQTAGGSATLGITAAGLARGNIKGSGELLVAFDIRTITLWTIGVGLALTDAGGASVPQLVAGTVGKIDSDTFDDIAVARGVGVTVYRGGAAGLSPPIATPVTLDAAAVAIGDVNGDGTADLAYTQVDPTATLLGLLPGAGAGAFFDPVTTPLAGVGRALALGDIDGDGKQDIVVGTGTSTYQLDVLLGTATGFATPVPLPIAGTADFLHTGDFNGDEQPDLIVTNTLAQTITVFESNP